VGDQWVPGKNLPFDPVAARRGSEIGLKVISAGGRDIENLIAILEGREFKGSVIGPD
jgi:uridylate kinase